LVGDIHSENYGTYSAADNALHYDINDFDETTHGRLDFDVCSLATSLFLAASDGGQSVHDAVHVTLVGLSTYSDTVRRVLKKGKGLELDINQATASTYLPMAELVRRVSAIRRPGFIKGLTELRDG
jgi:uncharacterized protein (DUF2252 family)